MVEEEVEPRKTKAPEWLALLLKEAPERELEEPSAKEILEAVRRLFEVETCERSGG